MSTTDPFSEGVVSLFTWGADKALAGLKRTLGWTWDKVEWARAQDTYDKEIIERYGKIRIFGQATAKALHDIFTDVYVLDEPTAFRRFSPVALADYLWNEDRSLSFRYAEAQLGEQFLDRGRKFFILGRPGAGKTTFLKRLAVREAQRGRWGRCLNKVPIFVPLKQFAESGKPMFEFIVDQFAVCHFPDAAPFVEGLLKSGYALVLFDGLDEVTWAEDFQANRRGQVTEILENFSHQYTHCHIVITCRIAAIDYTFSPAFTYLEMSDFGPEQVDMFVHNWFRDEAALDASTALAERMLAELAQPEHDGIRDLARSPLLLTLLCLNYDETHSFPARRVEIYEEALDALLKKWDKSRNIQRGGAYHTLSLGRKRQMFARIAYDAFNRNEILFQQSQLEKEIKAYLQHVPELPNPIDMDAESVLQEIIAQHGIFAVQAHRFYSFAHLTFQEYYAAKYIDENATPAVLEALLTHISDSKWREVLVLTASMLSEGTALLIGFENALQRMVGRNSRLVSLLQWATTSADSSTVVYQKPVVRVWYILSFALERLLFVTRNRLASQTDDIRAEHDDSLFRLIGDAHKRILTLGGSVVFDYPIGSVVEVARKYDDRVASALELAREIDNARYTLSLYDHTLALDLELNNILFHEFDTALNEVLGFYSETVCSILEQRGRSDLSETISAIKLPDPGSAVDQFQFRQYVTKIRQAFDAGKGSEPLKRLLTETSTFIEANREQSLLGHRDFVLLLEYCRATLLFYNCLHLAYVPNRHSLEERMFLPPEAPNGER